MKAIIFDLDGTLLNSLEDIALSMNVVLKKLGFPTHDIEAYNYFVGDGALVLVQNALPKNSSKQTVQEALEEFKRVYESNIHNNTLPYQGIYELLHELQNLDLQLGILSNKPHKFTLHYAKKLFSQFDFVQIHGQKEGIPKKPDPAGIIHIAQKLNLNMNELCYVGDTATDIKTAKAASVKSIGVLWGFRPQSELEEHGADFLAHEPNDILNIVKALKQGV